MTNVYFVSSFDDKNDLYFGNLTLKSGVLSSGFDVKKNTYLLLIGAGRRSQIRAATEKSYKQYRGSNAADNI